MSSNPSTTVNQALPFQKNAKNLVSNHKSAVSHPSPTMTSNNSSQNPVYDSVETTPSMPMLPWNGPSRIPTSHLNNIKTIHGWLVLLDKVGPPFQILWKPSKQSKAGGLDGKTKSDPSESLDPWDPPAVPSWPLPFSCKGPPFPFPVPAVLEPTASEQEWNRFNWENQILHFVGQVR